MTGQAIRHGNPAFSEKAQWIGAVRLEDSGLPAGRRDFHSPSLKKPEIKAVYDSVNPLALRSILLRKAFFLNKKIKRAAVSVSGLGHYLLYINGEKVSRDIFTPAWSDYDKSVYYNTYEPDTLLVKGENVIGVMLGNGFYNAIGNRYRKLWITFGPPTLLLELQVEYADGSREIIRSDESWKYALSPVTFNDIYGGEDYDARLEQDGWGKTGFDDSQWKTVVIQEAPHGILRMQQLANVRCMEEYGIKSITKTGSSYVLDMGQNLSGYPSIKVTGKRGQSIRLTVGEQLDAETGSVSQKQSGSPHFYTYTLKGGGVESWNPAFSYYGFRYIQIDSASFEPCGNLPQILGVKSCFIYNSTPETGSFECSNELFNRTHQLIKNAVKSNMQSIFTDCPHREKLGWLEQTHLNCGALLYNWDLIQFYPKIMQDIADSQLENGMIPTTAPEYVVFSGKGLDVFRDSPEWGIAAIMLPWLHYRFYGDKALMEKHFNVMKRYADYLTSKSENHLLDIGLGDWYDYGDHRAGFSRNSPVEVSATAHYFYAVRLFSEMAKLVGRKDDERKYGQLANEIRQAFNTAYFNTQTKQYANGSQFCNAIAIFMDLVPAEHKDAVLDNLKADIRAHGNRLTTGDVGNRYLFQALAQNGENELLYRMFDHEETPGYGFQLKFGATTLAEQWDPRKGASWNHFMMGQIEEWFFGSLAGIVPLSPGFKKFSIQPQPVGNLTHVKANYKTPHGAISAEWRRRDSQFTLCVEVPPNTEATVILPDGNIRYATTGRHNFSATLQP
jgi:hypothetical protein